MSPPDPASRCPCTSGLTYGECCGPRLDGTRPAPTAETLMRSRFTAFAVGDVAHLRASWHPTTRPETLGLDPDVRWYRLDVVDVVAGGPFDDDGEVAFRAFHRSADGRGVLAERSRFVRDDGRWYYLDGVVG
ncbi:MAG: SEC-C domain-containing protein [Gordonia polyisoprenivorans]|nr:SEC-C domain-containing protein [Gordonia polyisoprenivorans]